MNARTREEGFGPEVKRRIMIGTYALSAGYYDAYYGQAQQARTLVIRAFDAAYEQLRRPVDPDDPVGRVPSSAPRSTTRSQMYLSDLCTIPSNLAGHPAMSVPFALGERRSADRRPGPGPGARRGGDVARRAARACEAGRAPSEAHRGAR